MMPNGSAFEAILGHFWIPKSIWNWCPRGYFFTTFLEPSIKRLSERIRSPFLRFMRLLEVAKVMIFPRKITDFKGSALILSLPLNPLFGSLGGSQKPFKRRPKSTSEGYQIQLRLERSFIIASKTDLGSKMTPQTAPQIGSKTGPIWVA